MTRDKILDRIAKLFAKAESAEEFGSVAEAEAFAAKGQELLLKHKVKDTELAARLESNEEAQMFQGMTTVRYFAPDWDHKYLRSRTKWREQLAGVIARGFQCQILVVPGSNSIIFCGLEADATFCVRLYARLVDLWEREGQRAYDREYNRAYDKGESTAHMRGYKANWLLAATRGLRDKLNEQLAAMVTGTALIRLTGAVTRFVDKEKTGTASALSGPRHFNRKAAQEGYTFGKSISLRDEVKGNSNKQLGG